MKVRENMNGTKTHFFAYDEHPEMEKVMELVGGSGIPCTVTISTDREVPKGSTLICDDMGHVGPQVPPINTSATEVYHSTCIPGTSHPIVGDAVVLCAEPLQDTKPT